MFVTNEETNAKWFWADGKMHELTVENSDGEMNLKELYESCSKIMQDKEDACKNIYHLGVALTSSGEGGWGFLVGWLLRSIKKDQTWNIQHFENEVPKEEIIEHFAEAMEEQAKLLREKKDEMKLSGVTPTVGTNDGTDLFK